MLLQSHLMDIRSIRRGNLEILISRYGTIEALADLFEGSASYLSQIRTDDRGMGARLARKIEDGLGLLSGWMDSIQDSSGISVPVEFAYFRILAKDQREALITIMKSMVAANG